MSEDRYPIIVCDGDDGMCGEFELDHTLGGLARLVGSETQLPPGWSGARPGGGGEHYCPRCTDERTASALCEPSSGTPEPNTP